MGEAGKACRAPGKYSLRALRSRLVCRVRSQTSCWWARARMRTAAASSLSPATSRWLWRSVRTRSASSLASPASDLAPPDVVAVTVARRRARVDGVDAVAGREQGPHPGARSVSMPMITSPGPEACAATSACRAVMPATPSGRRRAASRLARFVHEMDVVVVFGPVVAQVQGHRVSVPLRFALLGATRRVGSCDGLMDQCSWHDTP